MSGFHERRNYWCLHLVCDVDVRSKRVSIHCHCSVLQAVPSFCLDLIANDGFLNSGITFIGRVCIARVVHCSTFSVTNSSNGHNPHRSIHLVINRMVIFLVSMTSRHWSWSRNGYLPTLSHKCLGLLRECLLHSILLVMPGWQCSMLQAPSC